MLPDDESLDKHPLADADNGNDGGGTPPRRRTAVGAGGPDDDFEKGIREFRLNDIEDPLNEAHLQSWPIPGITFVKLDGILNSVELDEECVQSNEQPPQNQDPNQMPKRLYLMEDALTGLSSQKAYIAFATIGNTVGVSYFMGLALQQPPEGMDQNLSSVCYNIQRSILNSVYNGIDIHQRIYSSDDLRTVIEPLANNIGVVTGIALLKSGAGDTFGQEQIERIASGLQGDEFGMLVLAAPIPQKMLSDEEYIILDQIQKAQQNGNRETKRRVKYYLKLQEAYLRHIQLGQSIGHWQVGVYFFAPKPDVFVRLQSLIKATYLDEGVRPTPVRTHVSRSLKKHLLDFGLLRNHRADSPIHKLLQYHFLTPLNSRMLSAYIHLPKRDMPGFKVHCS
ncbi:MAG: hypothetical protein K2X77_12115 [Candidatus Obscuribacterales bacterium]|jgi:hypothetical protein|nr:hypothetical protein [Candidatus Obscuribacterales bacterium]